MTNKSDVEAYMDGDSPNERQYNMKNQNAKHTPGPWSIQPIGDETECNVLGYGRELVATVSDNDARLIAAAPDLLAACEEAISALSAALPALKRGSYEWTGTHTTIGNIRAAIAKAQGDK